MQKILSRLLCLLGIHEFRVIDATLGFGAGGGVEKVQCGRCGMISTRRAGRD